MNSQELRQKFFSFFKDHGHSQIPSASLVPRNDPTVLFTTAGMHPLVPYLLGEAHPLGRRLVSVQKCIRTSDIEAVGDDSHLTFFEMLGNWSLGDYFKKEAIEWSLEFLTNPNWLGLNKEDLAVSVFQGDEHAPCDLESAKIWRFLGISEHRISYLGREDNWWGPASKTGPAGPDTEIFFWRGHQPAPLDFDPKDGRWVEIWNNVFMEFNKNERGKFMTMSQKNVDTGLGLERALVALNGLDNVYQTDLFAPLLKALGGDSREHRIIADHIKAAVFILADGVIPGNKEQSYILRRLIRRAIREEKAANLEELGKLVVLIYQEPYPELLQTQSLILDELAKEKGNFQKTLEKGLKAIEKLESKDKSGKVDAQKAFYIYQSLGFPLEMIQEELKKKGLFVETKEFQAQYKAHQTVSRQGIGQRFAGGLADHSQATTRLHTATHLLNEALRQTVSSSIKQRGSNITAERLRFDFNFSRTLTAAEIKQLEILINKQIKSAWPVARKEMPLTQALAQGVQAEFGAKYPAVVSVYSIGGFSREICGGPHVANTSELGKFKILKEESVSAGIRRIRAILK